MANVKISALPAVSTVVPGTDVLPLVSGGITTKATPTQIVSAALNNPQVISVNSASDALRITQVGAGNALIVEDSTNPDSTPVVINNGGQVVVGGTTAVSSPNYNGSQIPQNLQSQSAVAYDGLSLQNYVVGSGGAGLTFAHSRSGALGTQTILNDGDRFGSLVFAGSDGAAFIRGAQIDAHVDGVPGTNDMPGRLVFSTTADGASSPTERMRIDNAGSVGIGGVPNAARTLTVSRNISGGVNSTAVRSDGVVQSGVTAASRGFHHINSTAAASFTLPSAYMFFAEQGTIGAGSAVTNQYGYFADASLTGATNNYGFYSNIASGTGRYNFYAAGTAANYFAGDLTIYGGTAVPAGGTAGVGYKFSSTSNLGVFFGSGAPTLAAAQGSLYVRTDGSSTSTRLYVNTNGSTTWTNVTTAA